MDLPTIVADIGASIKRIDSRGPQAANVRSGALYQPGIGPHPETQAVGLIVAELRQAYADRYEGLLATGIAYPVRMANNAPPVGCLRAMGGRSL